MINLEIFENGSVFGTYIPLEVTRRLVFHSEMTQFSALEVKVGNPKVCDVGITSYYSGKQVEPEFNNMNLRLGLL